jgi:hypothetical protein
MFKIEAKNPIYGSKILWNTSNYRFKHVVSGRYLSFDKTGTLCLTTNINKESLFKFHPINFLATGEIKKYVK